MNAPLSILLLNHHWFVEELRSRGHRVVSAGWFEKGGFDVRYETPGLPIGKVLALLPSSFTPEVILYLDDSGPVSSTGLHELPIPLVFYSVDAHHHAEWHRCFASGFDFVWVAQNNYLEQFRKYHQSVEWLPLWTPVQPKPVEPKTIDVCFRGNLDSVLHPKRAQFFDELSQKVPVDAQRGPYLEAYPKAKIVMNQAVGDDLNFRVFEAMACGALLITPSDSSGLFELFADGEDLVTYENGNVQEAAEKIRYYLENDAERAAIADRGRRKVIEQHTPMARALQIEERLYKVRASTRPLKHHLIARSLFYSARTSKKVSEQLNRNYLLACQRELLKGAELREEVNRDFLFSLHLCKYELIRLGRVPRALELMRGVLLHCPEDLMLRLSLVETLAEFGLEDEIVEHAARLGMEPSDCKQKAVEVMSDARKAIESQLREPVETPSDE